MIYLASDHAGFELKEKAKQWLTDWGYAYEDVGPFVFDSDDDYPDFAHTLAERVAQNTEENRGIMFGGSGQGEAMVPNRYAGIRAAVFYGPRTAQTMVDIERRESADPYEIVRLSREHNNANILAVASRFVSVKEAEEAVRIFLTTQFSKKERHVRRIEKIDQVKG